MLRRPHITPGTPEEQIRQLVNYLFILIEELEYELTTIKTTKETNK